MEIKIGITQSNRELSVSLDEVTDSEAFLTEITTQLAEQPVLKLAESTGRTLLIPSTSVAYLELRAQPTRTVGFGGF